MENQQQTERKPLEWTDEEVLENKNLCARITSARIKGKKIHSVQFGRNMMRDGEKEKMYAKLFFRGIDMADMQHLCEEIRLWIQADVDEDNLSKNNRR